METVLLHSFTAEVWAFCSAGVSFSLYVTSFWYTSSMRVGRQLLIWLLIDSRGIVNYYAKLHMPIKGLKSVYIFLTLWWTPLPLTRIEEIGVSSPLKDPAPFRV